MYLKVVNPTKTEPILFTIKTKTPSFFIHGRLKTFKFLFQGIKLYLGIKLETVRRTQSTEGILLYLPQNIRLSMRSKSQNLQMDEYGHNTSYSKIWISSLVDGYEK